jgi:hypothetical protein
MKKLVAISFILVLFSCGNKKASIEDFTWIEGKWNGTTGEMNFFEDWQPLAGKVLNGRGGAFVGTDTVFSEKVRIEEREDGVYYVATVKENSAPVDFKFTGYNKDSIVFENPAHDFPQRVIYFRGSAGKL